MNRTQSLSIVALSLCFAQLVACNPCASPTVASSSVTIADETTGAEVLNPRVTVQPMTGSLLTFTCPMTDTDAGSDAGVTPTDGGSSGAPMAGTRCTFAGGLPNGPLTLRVEAPGYVALERAITAAELTQPTGCGFAVSLSVRLRAQ